MKTDANGELKGLAKGDKMKKVSVKPNKTKNWLLRDS
ncbi:uropathogenic specific protein [Vibrio cholerae]|nr:uropathogenic specific protein [Vibrio cholerae]